MKSRQKKTWLERDCHVAQSTIEDLVKVNDSLTDINKDQTAKLARAERLVRDVAVTLDVATKTLGCMSELLTYAENGNTITEEFKDDHKAASVDFVNRCKAFDHRYDLDFVPPSRESQTRLWRKAKVAGDLVIFCEPDDSRFDLPAVSDTT